MRRSGTSKSGRSASCRKGVAGLLRDKARPLSQAVKVVALTAAPPAKEAAHWTSATTAKEVGVCGARP